MCRKFEFGGESGSSASTIAHAQNNLYAPASLPNIGAVPSVTSTSAVGSELIAPTSGPQQHSLQHGENAMSLAFDDRGHYHQSLSLDSTNNCDSKTQLSPQYLKMIRGAEQFLRSNCENHTPPFAARMPFAKNGVMPGRISFAGAYSFDRERRDFQTFNVGSLNPSTADWDSVPGAESRNGGDLQAGARRDSSSLSSDSGKTTARQFSHANQLEGMTAKPLVTLTRRRNLSQSEHQKT